LQGSKVNCEIAWSGYGKGKSTEEIFR